MTRFGSVAFSSDSNAGETTAKKHGENGNRMEKENYLEKRRDSGAGDGLSPIVDTSNFRENYLRDYLQGANAETTPISRRFHAHVDHICVEKIRARVDQRPITIDEKTPAVVVFKSPPFKAAARVSIPALFDNETWTVGWIQACSKMKFRITYGTEGFSSWEFPQLKTQSMISDSDGRNFPWYGGNREIATLVGPCKRTTVEVRMTDSFAPRVTWLPPFYPQPLQERVDIEARLTRILRDQSFYTWLAARNESTREMVVLATIKWRAFIDVAFDPKAPLGQRATVIGDGYPKFQPEILRVNEPIPHVALSPPHANEAQILVWRQHGSKGEEILIPSSLPSNPATCKSTQNIPRSPRQIRPY